MVRSFVSAIVFAAPLAAVLVVPAAFPPAIGAPDASGAAATSGSPPPYTPDPRKVLRYSFEVAETNMDPQRTSDVYSNIVHGAQFDTPLRYDHLARPSKLIPNTAAVLPEYSPDFRTLTIRIRPGIHFAPHPVFGDKKRELVAEDYVYSIKRTMDPKLRSPLLAEIEGHLLGSEEAVARARKINRFDYDAPFEGIKTLDRYTFQIRFTHPLPIWWYNLADCRVSCAVAREIVEHYGDDIVSHPVGTGPYRLVSWKRSSRMVFEPNPNFREEYYDASPAPDDAEGQAILKRLKGRRLPMVHRVEVAIIEERQPRYLSFINKEFELLWLLPEDFANVTIPNNRLVPSLAKQGIRMAQVPALDLTYVYFNMKDAQVGGYAPEKVALRRAIALAYKTQDEIAIIRKGQAVPAHTPYAPGVAGYDPSFRTSISEYDPAKARALLDMVGYVDRDGDGYRENPDGSKLVLRHNFTPTERDKQFEELWKRSMDEIGLRIEFRKAKWPDLLKESDAGKLMMWQLGGSASAPDADTWLTSLYGPNAGFKGNRANFIHREYDELYAAASRLPDSPERTALYQSMAKLVAAYVPWKVNVHRIITDLWYPYVIGFRRPPVQTQQWWKYVDIDLDEKSRFDAKR